jgi:hypothetical protein
MLAGDANADIMMTIIECVRARVLRGARTFMIKIKAHTEENLSMKKPTPKLRTLDNYHLNVSSGQCAPKG